MKADHLTFKRATGVSLLGLGLQLLMGLVLLVYSVIHKEVDIAAQSGAFMILAGAIVWITLAVVFDQHRRERLEAMESEALAAASAREASVFGERPDELRVAAKRLAWMHKWLVPLVSLLFAGVLAALGAWRLVGAQAIHKADSFKSLQGAAPGWAIAIGLSLAFVGFVFARYVSGMAKQPAWANLRAGAAQSVGAALVGLAIAVAQFVDNIGTDAIARGLLTAIPVAMLIVAGEVVLNFLLGMYRPRRPGEIPRPALDSRILGFVAAPDRIAESIGGAINYQFGFDVTGSWFYQLLSRSVVVLALVGVAVIWGLTTIGVVQPNEQGLRVRFGARVGDRPLEPGAYVKLPWPLERIERYDTATLRRLDLGSETPNTKGKSILWTNDHGVAEAFFVVRPSEADRQAGREIQREKAATGEEAPAGAKLVGGDVSLIAAEVPLVFQVTDLARYEALAPAERRRDQNLDQREEVLRAIARREVFTYLATRTMDEVLGRGRTEISRVLRERVEKRLAALDAGIKVVYVGIEGVHPPKDTAEAFEGVVQALQRRAGAIENGTKDANTTLIKVAGSVEMAHRIVEAVEGAMRARERKQPAAEVTELDLKAEQLLASAGGEAAAKLAQAKALRWERHMGARGRAEQYTGQLAAYNAAPSVYTAQVYFDTLKRVLNKARVFIVADDAGKLEVRTDLIEQTAGGDVFNTPKKD